MITEPFQTHLHSLYKSRVEKDANRFRSDAWNQFLETGLPDKSWEAFRYVKLRSIFEPSYSSPAEPKSALTPGSNQILFHNGHFVGGDTNATLSPLTSAFDTFGSFLNNRSKQILKNEKDPFALLNHALYENGAFLYIPPGTILEQPITIHHQIDAESTLLFPRLNVFVGKGSEVTFHLTTNSSTCGVNEAFDFSLEEGARATLIQDATHSSDQWHFNSIRATLKRDSHFKTLSVNHRLKTFRQSIEVYLQGSGSEADLNGLSLLDGSNEAHSHILIEHEAPNCQSNQLFKNIVKDHAHSSFEGKIYVHSEAQQTGAYQLNQNLILSDHARAESKPNLEIFADDVKASHGSTSGKLDEEERHYLMTRGLSQKLADSFLILGFCKEVINDTPFEEQWTHIAKDFLS